MVGAPIAGVTLEVVSVAIDVSRVRADGFSFHSSAMAELISVLHLLVEPGHHLNRTAWVASVMDAIEPHLFDQILDLDYLWRTSRADMFLPAQPSDTLAGDLDALDALDDETWVSAALITSSCGTLRLHRGLQSPLVDPSAAAVARERAALRGPRQVELVESIMADPGRYRSRVRRILQDSDDAFFADVWARVRPYLVADARQKSDVYASEGLKGALSALSPAVSTDAGMTRIIVDKLQDDASAAVDGVTFIPTVFGHPHLLVVHAPRWTPVIQYPIVLSQNATHPASVDVVQRRLRALDNPVRMRLARSLIRGPKTTSELAELWGLGAPEVSRHLSTLKEADLVIATRRGRYVNYELDTVTTGSLGHDLVQALLR
ncbi:MAG: ArsR family transcriptional regulator [Frondihabitans sp.]|nr:ArsR family transcriptional regulator [Frondihabitans sp.]